jgi:hypothetical protein
VKGVWSPSSHYVNVYLVTKQPAAFCICDRINNDSRSATQQIAVIAAG